MLEKRIIPCLDIKNGKVVKGVRFLDLIDVGDPVQIAKAYEEQTADEVIFLDISADMREERKMDRVVERAADVLSIPMTVGGGIRSMEDFRRTLACGADKVSINSSAAANPAFIEEAQKEFGSQHVVVAIDGKKVEGQYRVFVKGGRENTGLDVVRWAKKVESLGAGEILLTSIDRDGTQNGYDIDMTKAVCDAVEIPVIASGGCGQTRDIIDLFRQTNCTAALAASLFHFGKATVKEVKKEMERNGMPCKKLTD